MLRNYAHALVHKGCSLCLDVRETWHWATGHNVTSCQVKQSNFQRLNASSLGETVTILVTKPLEEKTIEETKEKEEEEDK